jgi:hypothetical protein
VWAGFVVSWFYLLLLLLLFVVVGVALSWMGLHVVG